MTTTTKTTPLSSLIAWAAGRKLTPQQVTCLEDVLRDHTDALMEKHCGEVWGDPAVRQRYDGIVPPRAVAQLVAEAAGFTGNEPFAWLTAVALDEATGSAHRERLLALYGDEAQGVEEIEPDDDDDDDLA
jgi:hypothetical protein